MKVQLLDNPGEEGLEEALKEAGLSPLSTEKTIGELLDEWDTNVEVVTFQMEDLVNEMEALLSASGEAPESEEGPAEAVLSDFSLVDAQFPPNPDEAGNRIYLFFQGLQLHAAYDPVAEKYLLSGAHSFEQNTSDDTGDNTDKGNGEANGEYDPATGRFSGSFVYNQTYRWVKVMEDDGGAIDWSGTLFEMTGTFTGSANPNDTAVTLTFSGVNKSEMGEMVPYTMEVPFAVEGTLPFLPQT